MAKVTFNSLLKGFRGSIGGLVFRMMRDGSIRVGLKPNFKRRKFSQGQKDHQQRFREAARYARGVDSVHPIYAELAKGTMKTAYNIALSDWFNPPVIHQVKRRNGRILVQASDNVKVVKVAITILNDEGATLEKGAGIQLEGKWWEYVPSTEGKRIVAHAWDLPGHVATFENNV